jgi:hypothetical protein
MFALHGPTASGRSVTSLAQPQSLGIADTLLNIHHSTHRYVTYCRTTKRESAASIQMSASMKDLLQIKLSRYMQGHLRCSVIGRKRSSRNHSKYCRWHRRTGWTHIRSDKMPHQPRQRPLFVRTCGPWSRQVTRSRRNEVALSSFI